MENFTKYLKLKKKREEHTEKKWKRNEQESAEVIATTTTIYSKWLDTKHAHKIFSNTREQTSKWCAVFKSLYQLLCVCPFGISFLPFVRSVLSLTLFSRSFVSFLFASLFFCPFYLFIFYCHKCLSFLISSGVGVIYNYIFILIFVPSVRVFTSVHCVSLSCAWKFLIYFASHGRGFVFGRVQCVKQEGDWSYSVRKEQTNMDWKRCTRYASMCVCVHIFLSMRNKWRGKIWMLVDRVMVCMLCLGYCCLLVAFFALRLSVGV